jgi:hypothetical protein
LRRSPDQRGDPQIPDNSTDRSYSGVCRPLLGSVRVEVVCAVYESISVRKPSLSYRPKVRCIHAAGVDRCSTSIAVADGLKPLFGGSRFT